eukprot:460000_1
MSHNRKRKLTDIDDNDYLHQPLVKKQRLNDLNQSNIEDQTQTEQTQQTEQTVNRNDEQLQQNLTNNDINHEYISDISLFPVFADGIIQILMDYIPTTTKIKLLNLPHNQTEKQIILKSLKPLPTDKYYEIIFDIKIINGSLKTNIVLSNCKYELNKYLKNAKWWKNREIIDCDHDITIQSIQITILWHAVYPLSSYEFDELHKNNMYIDDYLNNIFTEYKVEINPKPMHKKYFTEYECNNFKPDAEHSREGYCPTVISSDCGQYIVRFGCDGFTVCNKNEQPYCEFQDLYHVTYFEFDHVTYFDFKIYDNKLYIIYDNVILVINNETCKAFDINGSGQYIQCKRKMNINIILDKNGTLKLEGYEEEEEDEHEHDHSYENCKFIAKNVIIRGNKLIKFDENNGKIIIENNNGFIIAVTNNAYVFIKGKTQNEVEIYKYCSMSNTLKLHNTLTIELNSKWGPMIAIDPNGKSLIAASFDKNYENRQYYLKVEVIQLSNDMKFETRKQIKAPCINAATSGHSESNLQQMKYLNGNFATILNSNGELFVLNCDNCCFVEHYYLHLSEGDYCSSVSCIDDNFVWWLIEA